MAFDGVWLAVDDEGSGVVDAGHLVEVLVLSGIAAHNIKFWVENIFSMSTVCHTVINDELDHDLFGFFTVETQILAIAADHVAILAKSLLDAGPAVRTVMLDQALGSDVLSVILARLSDLVAPSQWLNGSLLLEEVDSLVDSVDSFLGSERHLAWPLEQHALEFGGHFFEVWDEDFGVLSEVIMQSKYLLVHGSNVRIRSSF